MNIKRIAIQGIKASWHDVAARQHFGRNIELIECDTFRILCKKLESGEADYAMMAIENTIAGSILPNYALMHDYGFNIIGEVFVRIEMHLMALPGVRLPEIERVESHPMAILQCFDYLETLKGVRLIEKEDTAKAAKEIKSNNIRNTAAIAGRLAAESYGLEILQENIETDKQNFTRFLVLSKELSEQTTADKASIVFALPHKVGSLAEVLNIFKDNGVNLNKIQSVPIVGKPSQYSFHLDLNFTDLNNYHHSMKLINEIVLNLEVLGIYKSGKLPEEFKAAKTLVHD